jgi:hypothetical protein
VSRKKKTPQKTKDKKPRKKVLGVVAKSYACARN